jgi:hypothetical protein
MTVNLHLEDTGTPMFDVTGDSFMGCVKELFEVACAVPEQFPMEVCAAIAQCITIICESMVDNEDESQHVAESGDVMSGWTVRMTATINQPVG